LLLSEAVLLKLSFVLITGGSSDASAAIMRPPSALMRLVQLANVAPSLMSAPDLKPNRLRKPKFWHINSGNNEMEIVDVKTFRRLFIVRLDY